MILGNDCFVFQGEEKLPQMASLSTMIGAKPLRFSNDFGACESGTEVAKFVMLLKRRRPMREGLGAFFLADF